MRKTKMIALCVLVIVTLSLFMGMCIMIIMHLLFNVQIGTDQSYSYFKLGYNITTVVALLIYLTSSFRIISTQMKINKIMATQGATMELFAILKQQIDKAKSPKVKATAQLRMASYMILGNYFDECFKLLDEIDVNSLQNPYTDEYYNVYMYANLMNGNLEAAENIYKTYRQNFDRARIGEFADPVLHTLGMYEYGKGNYVAAESLFTQARSNTNAKSLKCECNLYLGLCYLKTDRKDYARSAALQASKQSETVYQRENLKKLMGLAEQAFEAQNKVTADVDNVEISESVERTI